jgi:hypothetical protein
MSYGCQKLDRLLNQNFLADLTFQYESGLWQNFAMTSVMWGRTYSRRRQDQQHPPDQQHLPDRQHLPDQQHLADRQHLPDRQHLMGRTYSRRRRARDMRRVAEHACEKDSATRG